MNLRRVGFLMALVLACSAPLQALAAVSSLPCQDSHHGDVHSGDMHSHGDDQQHQEPQQAHGCASCMACCAGAAISYQVPFSLPGSPAELAVPRPAAACPGTPPAQLDRPPQ
jgi:hypothetical protein